METALYRHTTSTFREIRKAEQVHSNCIAILFVNKGTDTAYVNGLPIAENEVFTLSQPENHIDRTQYDVYFANAQGETQSLFVIRTLPKE